MKTKGLIIALIAVVVILVLTTQSFALSFTPTMNLDKTTVAESTEFMVTVKISNIDAGSNGINSLEGYLEYDTKVFDPISQSSIEALGEWTYKYNSDNGKIVLTRLAFVKTEENVFQITFRTKANTSGQKGIIKFKNIWAYNSETEISASDISTTITVSNSPVANNVNNSTPQTVVVKPTNNTPQNITVKPTNNNTPTNVVPVNNNINNVPVNKTPVNNTPTNNTPVENKAKTDVPYTGADDVVVRVIFVVLVVAAISYFKFQSLNDEK